MGKHCEKVVLEPHRRTTSVYRRGGCARTRGGAAGTLTELGWRLVEDRENVILFATVLEVAREAYVDREATDTEK